ncbi:nucleotide-diphospho-sugar transferase [uncultured Duncaniella sp.]|uniref:nucleotide-diphospho-sugar transferase n=1 Tax=uncultured Duncaniella sp. TaxID=2768039 RepID=UPI00266F9C6A|nr:nucleotide-diphospho-sugar transferase [uncultured Duncaniella sp.]
MKSPVLLIIFNRPNTTQEVFNVIKKVKPSKLYVAGDGPRLNRPNERELCHQAQKIATAVDWNCEVKTLFQNENLGCKIAVSRAISWFFENEKEGIILEDDIVPHSDFFYYCDELLDKYRDKTNIGVVSGHNHVYNDKHFHDSYDFVSVSHCWGWGSWRHSWEKVDVSLSTYDFRSLKKALKTIYSNPSQRRFWLGTYLLLKMGLINSWAYPMTISFIINGYISIVPKHNLTKNIGEGENATHTSTLDLNETSIVLNPIRPIKHPSKLQINTALEYNEFINEHRSMSVLSYLKIRIKFCIYYILNKMQ